MRIHGLTVDRGGCFYYRIKQPLKALRDRGHWTSWGSVFDESTFDRANVIVGQMLNFPTTCEKWKEWAGRGDKLLVWEADDDITAVHRHAAHGKAYDDPETVPRMGEMIAASHLVTVTTEALAGVYRQWNDNVVVLPNSVPDWLLERPRRRVESSSLILTYTASPSHADDFEWWSRIYGKWMKNHASDTIMHLYGPDRIPIGLPVTWRVRMAGWEKMTEDYLRNIDGDIGIAPLLDTEFNRGKSGIKAVEYAALGIPSVCSDMQQYRDTVVDGMTGYLCGNDNDWLIAFQRLWGNPKLRVRMGEAGKEWVREYFTQSRTIDLWETAYLQAMERIGINDD